MRKILVKHVMHDMAYALFWIAISLVIFVICCCFLGTDDLLGASTNALIISLICNFRLKSSGLSDEVYILPLSRQDRMVMVKRLLFAKWILFTIVYSTIIMIPTGIQFLLTKTVKPGMGAGCFMLVLAVLSMSHLCSFYNYFEAIENYHTITIVVMTFVHMALFTSAEAMIMNGETEDLTGFCVAYAVCWLVNGLLHKHYFRDMVQFFASYENSRRIKEKKVRA